MIDEAAQHMKYTLEPMSEIHRKPVVDIFNYFVTNGFSAYPECEVTDEFFDRLIEMTRGYPAVVVKDQTERVIGFGMIRPYHFASTFRRTAEISYFLLPEFTRQGIGKAMLDRFSEESKKRNIDSILASISSKNQESINFHLKNGFTECGRLHRVGRKFGSDFDVVWMQKIL